MARSHQAPTALLSTCLPTALACALFAGALLASPAAWAQPEEGEEKKPAEGEAGEGEKKPDEAAVDTPDMGGWGVGGSEREGKYRPRGKTGKLKELEKEHGGEEGKEAEAALPKLPPPGFAFLDTAIGFGELVVPTQTSGATGVTPTASFLIK